MIPKKNMQIKDHNAKTKKIQNAINIAAEATQINPIPAAENLFQPSISVPLQADFSNIISFTLPPELLTRLDQARGQSSRADAVAIVITGLLRGTAEIVTATPPPEHISSKTDARPKEHAAPLFEPVSKTTEKQTQKEQRIALETINPLEQNHNQIDQSNFLQATKTNAVDTLDFSQAYFQQLENKTLDPMRIINREKRDRHLWNRLHQHWPVILIGVSLVWVGLIASLSFYSRVTPPEQKPTEIISPAPHAGTFPFPIVEPTKKFSILPKNNQTAPKTELNSSVSFQNGKNSQKSTSQENSWFATHNRTAFVQQTQSETPRVQTPPARLTVKEFYQPATKTQSIAQKKQALDSPSIPGPNWTHIHKNPIEPNIQTTRKPFPSTLPDRLNSTLSATLSLPEIPQAKPEIPFWIAQQIAAQQKTKQISVAKPVQQQDHNNGSGVFYGQPAPEQTVIFDPSNPIDIPSSAASRTQIRPLPRLLVVPPVPTEPGTLSSNPKNRPNLPSNANPTAASIQNSLAQNSLAQNSLAQNSRTQNSSTQNSSTKKLSIPGRNIGGDEISRIEILADPNFGLRD